MNKNKSKWVAMKMYDFSTCIELVNSNNKAKFFSEEGSPPYFLPVFDEREDAIKWAGGEEHILELRIL